MFQGNGEKTPDKVATNVESTKKSDEMTTSIVTPSRYDAIASLDIAQYNEEDRWNDRTSIITKFDHEEYLSYAQDVINELADNVVTTE